MHPTPVATVCDGAVVLGVLARQAREEDRSTSNEASSSSSSSRSMFLNPAAGFIVRPGDQLCVVAKDKTPQAFNVRDTPACTRTALPMPDSEQGLSERKANQHLMICNWRDDMEDVSTNPALAPLPSRLARCARSCGTLAKPRSSKMRAKGSTRSSTNQTIALKRTSRSSAISTQGHCHHHCRQNRRPRRRNRHNP